MAWIAFPLSPVPSHYKPATWTTAGQKRCGIHYPGETVTIKLNASCDATAYTVRDYLGNVVSSGSLTPGFTTFEPTPPVGGWDLGWYRVYLTGPNNDSLFGNAYSSTNFVFIPNDARFPTRPASDLVVQGGTGEFHDYPTKGFLGMGTSRLIISNVADPNAGTGYDRLVNMELAAAQASDYWTDVGHPNRPRALWCAFPNGSVDKMTIDRSDGADFFWAYVRTPAINGTQVFIQVEDGTTSGKKITVRSPDSATIVETYDNLNIGNDPAGYADRDAAVAIDAASSYIRFFWNTGVVNHDGAHPVVNSGPTAIGNAYRNGVIEIVSTLYPLGVTRFEGPSNEPPIGDMYHGPRIAHEMRILQDSVHTGNANAKAIGPCTVDIARSWYWFLAAGGADYCDEISFHAYNSPRGRSLRDGRHDFDRFISNLETFGITKPMWQTESNSVGTPQWGLYSPREASIALLTTLLFEQYGIPHERNNYWYDVSHGFWGVPAWWEQGDGSLNPQAIMYRTLAAETWGMPFDSALDFGELGNNMLIGNVYAPSAPSVPSQNLIETFDDGTDGATLPLNLWGPFGSGDGSPTYDSTHAHHGLAGKFLDNERRWCGGLQSPGTRHHRFYMYREAQGANAYIQVMQGGGNVRLVGNKIQIQDHTALGGHTQTGTVDVAIGQWVRVETQVVEGTTNGRVTARLYNDADSQIPSETIQSPATWYVNRGDMELRNGGLGIPVWFDDVVFDAADWVGPAAKVAAIQAASYMPNATTTLETDAAGPLTVVDAFGNESTVQVTAEEGVSGYAHKAPLWTSQGNDYYGGNGYTFSDKASFSALNIYARGTGAGAQKIKAAIWADNNGVPGVLHAVGSEVTIAQGQAEGWVELPFPTDVIVTPGRWWLGFLTNGPTWGGAQFTYISGGSFWFNASAGVYNTPTDFDPNPDFVSNIFISLYATYTKPGRSVIPVSDTPTFVRLPRDATVSIYAINGWRTSNAMLQARAVGAIGTQGTDAISDGDFMRRFPDEGAPGQMSSGLFRSANSVPENAVLTWEKAVRMDRVIVFAWPDQLWSTLLDFDVQTSINGTDWVTQATVDKLADAVSFKHGSNSNGVGCQRETYWDRQWIFDIPFSAPVTAKALRLVVTRTSFGGNPIDVSEALNGYSMGSGSQGVEQISLQEIVVICDDNAVNDHYSVVS